MRRAYVIASIELRQRMRSVAWIVLMAIVFLMMLVSCIACHKPRSRAGCAMPA